MGNEPRAGPVAGAHPRRLPDPVRLPPRLSGPVATESGRSPQGARAVCRYLAYSDGGPGTGGRLAHTGDSTALRPPRTRSGFRSRVWACGRSGVTRVSTQRSLPARPRNVRNCGRDPFPAHPCPSGSPARAAARSPSLRRREPRRRRCSRPRSRAPDRRARWRAGPGHVRASSRPGSAARRDGGRRVRRRRATGSRSSPATRPRSSPRTSACSPRGAVAVPLNVGSPSHELARELDAVDAGPRARVRRARRPRRGRATSPCPECPHSGRIFRRIAETGNSGGDDRRARRAATVPPRSSRRTRPISPCCCSPRAPPARPKPAMLTHGSLLANIEQMQSHPGLRVDRRRRRARRAAALPRLRLERRARARAARGRGASRSSTTSIRSRRSRASATTASPSSPAFPRSTTPGSASTTRPRRATRSRRVRLVRLGRDDALARRPRGACASASASRCTTATASPRRRPSSRRPRSPPSRAPGRSVRRCPASRCARSTTTATPCSKAIPARSSCAAPTSSRATGTIPTRRAAVLVDGWLHTGDIAVADADGWLTLVDRAKDVIIVSGFNVFPGEVEDALRSHRDVEDVAVIGEPHPRTGETVVAFVVAAPGTHARPRRAVPPRGPPTRALQAADARRRRRRAAAHARGQARAARAVVDGASCDHGRATSTTRRRSPRRSPRSRPRARSTNASSWPTTPWSSPPLDSTSVPSAMSALPPASVAGARRALRARTAPPSTTAPPNTTIAPTPLPTPASTRGSTPKWSLPTGMPPSGRDHAVDRRREHHADREPGEHDEPGPDPVADRAAARAGRRCRARATAR